jgi:GcrA cell cycle regulator
MLAPTEPTWTDERVAQLRELQAKQWSGSRIAAELRLTRNQVIGKLTRLGLRCTSQPPTHSGRNPARKAHPFKRKPKKMAGTVRYGEPEMMAKRFELADLPLEPLPASRRSIFELTEETCRWPIGDPQSSNFFFCGDRSIEGFPYCGHHTRMAYEPLQSRRR